MEHPANFEDIPKTKSKPSGAGSIWKGEEGRNKLNCEPNEVGRSLKGRMF